MIFVAGSMTFDPRLIPDFRRDVAARVDRVRAEPGCRHDSLRVEEATTGLVNVPEQRDNDDARIAHRRRPFIVECFNKIVFHLKASTVRPCDIAGERPLPTM